MIGLAPKSINLNGVNMYNICGYYKFTSGGTLYSQSGVQRGYITGVTSQIGDIVGVQYDKSKGDIKFYNNGKCIGTGYVNVKNQKLYPSICCSANGGKLEIVKGKYKK